MRQFIVLLLQLTAVTVIKTQENETEQLMELNNAQYDLWYKSLSHERELTSITGPREVILGSTFDTFLQSEWRSHVADVISRGIGQFSLDLDQYLEIMQLDNPDNLLFSPACLTLALATILLASGGKTFNEVSQVLGFDTDIDILNSSEVAHRIFGLLIYDYDKKRKRNPNLPIREVASGIFIQDGYSLRKQFEVASNNIYKTEVIKVDYFRNSSNARKVINDWVSNKTMKKIEQIMSENPEPNTDVIISSTLYFSGKWQKPFEEDTVRQPFKIGPNRTVYVDMMSQVNKIPFYEDSELGLKMIGLPYIGSEVFMYIILPNDMNTSALRRLKRQLTIEKLDSMIESMESKECTIMIPKMDLSSTLGLREALESLGLISLFDSSCADLSLLSPGKDEIDDEICDVSAIKSPEFISDSDRCRTNMLRRKNSNHGSKSKSRDESVEKKYAEFIKSQRWPSFGIDKLRIRGCPTNPGIYAGDIVHAVKMTVDQSGTTAAAATLTMFSRIGSQQLFIANRPFLLLIRHKPSKNIWFWGSIYNPTPSYSG